MPLSCSFYQLIAPSTLCRPYIAQVALTQLHKFKADIAVGLAQLSQNHVPRLAIQPEQAHKALCDTARSIDFSASATRLSASATRLSAVAVVLRKRLETDAREAAGPETDRRNGPLLLQPSRFTTVSSSGASQPEGTLQPSSLVGTVPTATATALLLGSLALLALQRAAAQEGSAVRELLLDLREWLEGVAYGRLHILEDSVKLTACAEASFVGDSSGLRRRAPGPVLRLRLQWDFDPAWACGGERHPLLRLRDAPRVLRPAALRSAAEGALSLLSLGESLLLGRVERMVR